MERQRQRVKSASRYTGCCINTERVFCCFLWVFFFFKDRVLLFYFVLAKTLGEDGRFSEEVIMLGESTELPSCLF